MACRDAAARSPDGSVFLRSGLVGAEGSGSHPVRWVARSVHRLMSLPLEDYALLSDARSAALVSRGGSIDWLGYPRFDSPTFFAKLLGSEENGHWTLAPLGHSVRSERKYKTGSLVLETTHHTPDGTVRVVDALVSGDARRLVRHVKGVRGRVRMRSTLRVRFEYGSVIPWVRRIDGAMTMIAGAEALCLRSDVETFSKDYATFAEFELDAGDSASFELSWYESGGTRPKEVNVPRAITRTTRWWRDWSQSCRTGG